MGGGGGDGSEKGLHETSDKTGQTTPKKKTGKAKGGERDRACDWLLGVGARERKGYRAVSERGDSPRGRRAAVVMRLGTGA